MKPFGTLSIYKSGDFQALLATLDLWRKSIGKLFTGDRKEISAVPFQANVYQKAFPRNSDGFINPNGIDTTFRANLKSSHKDKIS